MKEVDSFSWDDMVRWHCQHQRIQGEAAEMIAAQSQLAQLNALASVMNAPVEPEE